MKKVLIIPLIFLSINLYSQENNFERPDYFVGITPLKPFISSAIGLSFHQKLTESTYLGLEPTIYAKINGSLYRAANGIKIYSSFRNYFSEKRPSSFYGQVNLGGGYFSQCVTYVAEYFNNENYYPINRQKQFLALGGSLQLGYHFMVYRFSVDINFGFQILLRILEDSINYQGTEFRRDRAQYESFYSDDLNWGLFGPGSIFNSTFTLKYNIFKYN